MSDQLYIERLWWNAHYRTGVARHGGREVHLSQAPPGLEHAIVIDYAPAVDVQLLQGHGGKLDDMNEAERLAARAYLDSLFKDATP